MPVSARFADGGAQVRAAVVGAGVMGRWHARELLKAGGELVGVADPDAPAAASLAGTVGTAGTAGVFRDVDDLLEQACPDAVHVCTPTDSHESIVERALAAGSHVLVEKPLASDAATTKRLLESFARRGLLLCPVHQYLFQPGTARARRRLPGLGPLVQVEATACSAGGLFARGVALDEVAADILPHALAVLQVLVPGGVEHLDWRVLHPRDGELRALAGSTGTGVSICVSMNGRPTRNELRAIGEGGTVHIDFFHGYAVVQRGAGVSRARKVAHPFSSGGRRIASAGLNLGYRAARREPAYPGLRELITRFYGAVRTGGPPPIPSGDTLAVAAARDRLLELVGHPSPGRSETAPGQHVRHRPQ